MPRLRKPASPFRYYDSSPEVIRLTVMMYVRFPLSLSYVEDVLFERRIDIRRQRVSRMKGCRQRNWHLDEVCVKISGEMHYLWRTVDQEGWALENYVTKTRDKQADLRLIKRCQSKMNCGYTDSLGCH